MGSSKSGPRHPERKALLRPIVGLATNLSRTDLERITVHAIKKHRLLRDIAESKELALKALPLGGTDLDTAAAARLAYVDAMIEMHAQQTVVSTLLDVLGYVPNTKET